MRSEESTSDQVPILWLLFYTGKLIFKSFRLTQNAIFCIIFMEERDKCQREAVLFCDYMYNKKKSTSGWTGASDALQGLSFYELAVPL